jgi:hypothetical protein
MAVSETLVGFLGQFPTIGRQPSCTRGYTLLYSLVHTYRQSQLNQVTGYPAQQAVLEVFLDVHPSHATWKSLVTKPVGPLSMAAYYLGTI